LSSTTICFNSHEIIFAEGASVETLLANSADELIAFDNATAYPQANFETLARMTPFAPVLGYGGMAHATALLRRAASTVIDIRDPIQVAYDRIATRCLQKLAA
jgi:hypothetical protein